MRWQRAQQTCSPHTTHHLDGRLPMCNLWFQAACRTYEDVLEAAAGRGPGAPGGKALTLNATQVHGCLCCAAAAAELPARLAPVCVCRVCSSRARARIRRGHSPSACPANSVQRFALDHRQDLLEGTGSVVAWQTGSCRDAAMGVTFPVRRWCLLRGEGGLQVANKPCGSRSVITPQFAHLPACSRVRPG